MHSTYERTDGQTYVVVQKEIDPLGTLRTREADSTPPPALPRQRCERCGGVGWIELADESPAFECDHRPLLHSAD